MRSPLTLTECTSINWELEGGVAKAVPLTVLLIIKINCLCSDVPRKVVQSQNECSVYFFNELLDQVFAAH